MENIDKESPGEQANRENTAKTFNLWQTAWELGYTIAVPIVLFAFAGRWADSIFGTTPWLLVSGIILSAFASSYLVYRKVSKLM